MRVGIISNSDLFIPLAYTLGAQKLQVCIFYSLSQDKFVNAKVESFALQSKIPFLEEKDREKDLYDWLCKEKFDFVFIIGYSHLIILDKIAHLSAQLFNIHFGPLPSYGGPCPVFWQLKFGEANLGLSIHRLNSKFDKGEVVWRKFVPNEDYYNNQIVNQIFSQICVEGVFFILNQYIMKQTLNVLDDSNLRGSYHHKPKLRDIQVNWNEMSAVDIKNLINAGNPWNKGALTSFDNYEIKLMDARVDRKELINNDFTPGLIMEIKDYCRIACVGDFDLLVGMFFFSEAYIPAYHLGHYGFIKGKQFK